MMGAHIRKNFYLRSETLTPGGIFNTISWSPVNLAHAVETFNFTSYFKAFDTPAKDGNVLVCVGKSFLLFRERQHHLKIKC